MVKAYSKIKRSAIRRQFASNGGPYFIADRRDFYRQADGTGNVFWRHHAEQRFRAAHASLRSYQTSYALGATTCLMGAPRSEPRLPYQPARVTSPSRTRKRASPNRI